MRHRYALWRAGAAACEIHIQRICIDESAAHALQRFLINDRDAPLFPDIIPQLFQKILNDNRLHICMQLMCLLLHEPVCKNDLRGKYLQNLLRSCRRLSCINIAVKSTGIDRAEHTDHTRHAFLHIKSHCIADACQMGEPAPGRFCQNHQVMKSYILLRIAEGRFLREALRTFLQ